jgi:hypothetical protein
MTEEELRVFACNTSLVHTCIMISTPETDVFEAAADGAETPIIRQGTFVGDGCYLICTGVALWVVVPSPS